MPAPRKYPLELRERAVRMYRASEPKPVIRRLAENLPPPQFADLFAVEVKSRLPGGILLAPMAIWLIRRGVMF